MNAIQLLSTMMHRTKADISTKEAMIAEAEALIRTNYETFLQDAAEASKKGEKLDRHRNDMGMQIIYYDESNDEGLFTPLFTIPNDDFQKFGARALVNWPTKKITRFALICTIFSATLEGKKGKDVNKLHKEMIEKYGSISNFPKHMVTEKIMVNYEDDQGDFVMRLYEIDDSGRLSYDKDKEQSLEKGFDPDQREGRLVKMLNDTEVRLFTERQLRQIPTNPLDDSHDPI